MTKMGIIQLLQAVKIVKAGVVLVAVYYLPRKQVTK